MTAPDPQVVFAMAVKQLRENLPAMLDYEMLNAKVTRAKYIALCNEGFTSEQAIELCKRS